MSATQHTPGPWKADLATHRGCTYIQQPNEGENGGWVVATCWGADRETNARLIAAAPDLLAFAKRVASWQGNEGGMSGCVWSELIRQASEAIARATGAEGEGAK